MTDNINKNKQLDPLIASISENVLKEILSPDKAILARPLFLKNRTLTITCSDSEIAQEIAQNQQEIVLKINDKLGKNEIDRVRYLT